MKLSTEDYNIHNEMEDVADLAIQRVLSKEPSACSCPLCQSDMKSLILNQLKPKYYPVLTGITREQVSLEKLETELFNQVLVESYRAMLKVRAQPRHDQNRSNLHNFSQDAVLHALKDVLTQEKRTLDREDLSRVMASALNGLKPRYATTPKGGAFTRTVEIDTSYSATVYSNIYNALKEIPELTTKKGVH